MIPAGRECMYLLPATILKGWKLNFISYFDIGIFQENYLIFFLLMTIL